MRVRLREAGAGGDVVTLAFELEPTQTAVGVRYATRTGALARVDGAVAGAFDREHGELRLPPSPHPRDVRLEVERHSLPTNGLPPGPGLRWRLLLARASETPATSVEVAPLPPPRLESGAVEGSLPLWGHSHLDVAWLWTYAQTRRKATRTFANAMALLDDDASFVFAQSQPQLYEFVADEDPAFFTRVVEAVRGGRFDASIAALWVEPDCNLPSGESLLRHMLAAHRYCAQTLEIEPSIAWLPDTFGFARTLPTLLAHAGIRYFGTTKLQWNDTTRFAHPQFRWRGPDGSEIVAASIDRMEGGADPARVAIARDRAEPLIVGYGDGGGGPTREQVAAARTAGRWESPLAWYERLDARRSELPVWDDELYLEYHRGVFTTHHDVKAANAALERRLSALEELAAWCIAVRAPAEALGAVRGALHAAWRVALRNQFHDVLPGTSIADVYADARAEYAQAFAVLDGAEAALRAMLPRAAQRREPPLVEPVERDGCYEFDNGAIVARVLPGGAVVELARAGGRSAIAQANLLATYRDRPKKWEAWNLDAGYERSRRGVRPQATSVADGGVDVRFVAGRVSPATMRLSLRAGEPFLRAELAVDWQERRRLLRVESWLAVASDAVTFGAPHGTIARTARRRTPAERAKFEVPGQRFAAVCDANAGVAMLALDTYGWSARALPRGGIALGHSLLRSTSWPDPQADRGMQHLTWAYAPWDDGSIGTLERTWDAFANEPEVRLFTCDDAAVAVAACKPAEDGDGVILRLRECDGSARSARVRCGGRMREAALADALERPLAGEVRIEGESLVTNLDAYGLRTVRVRF